MKLERVAVILLGLGIGGCATTSSSNASSGVGYKGGDGLTCESRVVIRGARGEQQGVAAEHAGLRRKYPGHKVNGQALMECQEHATDKLSITTADGRDVDVHFDISDFFGKGL